MRRVVLLSALAAIAAACEGSPPVRENQPATDRGAGVTRQNPGAATLEGNMRLVTRSGAVKRGAGNPVYLLRESSNLHPAIADICARYAGQLGHLEREYTAASQEATRLEKDDRAPRARVRAARNRVDSLSAERAVLANAANGLLERVLKQHEVMRTSTTARGRYRFAPVPPGNYRLYARTTIEGNPYTWWVPVELSRGEHGVRDLNDPIETVAEGPKAGLCGPMPRRAPKTSSTATGTPARNT